MSDQPIEIETTATPDASVIWLHGLGADGNDFAPIIPQLTLPENLGIRFIFPHAPHRPVTCNGGYVMRAWYDIYSLEEFDREDDAGFAESRDIVEALIKNETERGISPHRIILLGFSQGGAVVLHTGLRHSQTLAGIGALSTYLPLRDSVESEKNEANSDTPIFMAHGTNDPVVRYEYGDASRKMLQELDYAVDWNSYSMEHSVCAEEINNISEWITRILTNRQHPEKTS